MNFGYITNVYTTCNIDEKIINKIQISLKEKNVDEIKIENNLINFNNNFIGKRSNLNMMSGIDSGYFKLIKKDNCNQLIVGFSFRRVLLFWIIVSCVVFIANLNNLFIASIVCSFLSISILVAILRFKIFVKKIIKEFY
ncbi:hypothetical protein [Labilibaculum sp. K2S]|uniref:hypothetical protein n=1 Tax=Labilibaculum sp. K2S TaxID=3056386 RepID=UPI0025A3210E|nr:hypothetical protein [Labilibaculum sp. K2S]